MPFGLKNAPFTFSKMMADILHECDHFAIPYLDDVAIYSNSCEEHLSHLNAVMSKIKDAGLTIKPITWKFAQDRVKYLGHIVGRGIRTPNEVKVTAVLNFPVPTTKSQVKAFLGLAGYYNHYIPKFSSIVAPLTETLKGNLRQGKINWTEECTRAFKELKDKLSQQLILYEPDFNKEFILQTDAANSGMGVILAQKDDDDTEHPVLYLSKKFSESEKKYSTTEKECAAIIFAVKKLQCYFD
ncbi:Retrovirus-related Pol polyprotein from transposon 17.6 [Araneus ventricosus]|uniref:RNA-directed DNA polymerase n=1 Tax=Araneus ventricosus TaxID=182803 RepID=A0A4Y2VJJ7_ARAVE|nr:Retrovirus-related Pol polyprotein from transposon 17.6 [Araneus ventricosus]